MNEYIVENRGTHIVFHEAFMIAMVVSIYAYDYIISKNQDRNEIWYLVIAIVCLLGAIVTFIAFAKSEKLIAKSQKELRVLDKMHVEVVILISGILLGWLIAQVKHISVEEFSLVGLAITVGTMIFLIDSIMLLTFSSLYRKAIRKHLKADSILYFSWQVFTNYEKGEGLRELTRKSKEQARIKEALQMIADGQLEVSLDIKLFHGQEQEMALAINQIQEGLVEAVESRTRDERMKADLITNVSHDIKTPLTSIVNYVELLQREELDNENAKRYIHIIDEKAQRLKHLTEDLVEVSKISSGNIQLDMQKIDFLELLYQTGGEFNESFEARNLTIVTKMPATPVMIEADGRQLYRAIENLYTNAAKYAQENTTVYVELVQEKKSVIFTIKNISEKLIQITNARYQDLTDRFVRGDLSRTTEGSGLGLSIAKNLTTLMGGKFTVKVENNQFIAQIIFPVMNSR